MGFILIGRPQVNPGLMGIRPVLLTIITFGFTFSLQQHCNYLNYLRLKR